MDGFKAVFYSILAHLVLVLCLIWVAKSIPTDMAKDLKSSWVEMEILSHKQDQVILHAEAPKLDMNNAPTNLYSKEWQRVEKQQKAKITGTTANRSQVARNEVNYKKTQKQLNLEPGKNGNKIVQEKQQETESKPLDIPFRFSQIGSSSFGERVSDLIDIGDFTALNTDPHKFYSFHSRIHDRIRVRWVSNIENSIRFFKQAGLSNKIPRGEWVSTIDIILNKQGYFEKAYLKKASGIKAWDQAAIRAFRNGSPYLNPPQAMIEKDGKIRLTYSFSVRWDPSMASKIN